MMHKTIMHRTTTRKHLAFLFTFALGAVVGNLAIPSLAQQAHKPFMITRIYNGPDNVAHSEEVELKFDKEVSKMLPIIGAELHRGAPGRVSVWHQGPSRRYVITMSGHGELEVANGKKIQGETLGWNKARDAGIPIIVDPTLVVGHGGVHWFGS